MAFELGLAIAGIGGWFGLFGYCLLRTRPRPLAPATPTQDFGGDEPPAVVSLLAHGWKHTDTAARATLLDLAARRRVELRQPGADPRGTTVHLPAGDGHGAGAGDGHPHGRGDGHGDGDLTRYERRVLGRVRGLTADGVVPLTALTFRDAGEERAWSRRLKAEILADARQRGLTRRRFSSRMRTALVLATAAPTLAVLVAMVHYDRRVHPEDSAAFAATFGTFVVLLGVACVQLGERDTPAGRAAAQRWLGLREFLRGDEAFAALPPAAAGLWDRYLAYGSALGVARGCDDIIDLGMADRALLWSSYGGSWHQVRVRYPRPRGRYGEEAAPTAVRSAFGVVVGAMLLRFGGRAAGSLSAQIHDRAGLVFLAVGCYLVVRGVYRLVRVAADASSPVAVTGEVLWDQICRSTTVRTGGGEDDTERVPWLAHLAVDDGHTDRLGHRATTAWGAPKELWDQYHVGDVVRLTARPWSRRVLELALVTEGRARQLAEPPADDATEHLIAEAMGVAPPGQRPAVPAPSAAALLTAGEVGWAVGRPVTVASTSAAAGDGTLPVTMPVSTQVFEAGGRQVVSVMASSGLAARLTMRLRRDSAPLAGIGDEAYVGERWAIARRGGRVVGVRVDDRAGPLHPDSLRWLLATAASRLPDDRSRPGRPLSPSA